MSSTMNTIKTVSGVLGNLARFLGMGEFGSLAAFFGSAAFATAFAGIIAVGVVGAAWMALLSKWGELVGLRKKYKEEGNRKLAQSEIAQLKSEGVDMSFAENAATTGEMARAVANTRLTQGSITPEEWEKLKDRGVTPPKSGQGFTDEDALKYLEVRKELANEKLTGKSGALGTLQANMQVALGGEAVYAAERKRTMRHVPSAGFSPSTALPTYGATASGFVEGGDADIHEALPEGRTLTRMPADGNGMSSLLSQIRGGESAGGEVDPYDTTLGHGRHRKEGHDKKARRLTDMTLREIYDLQTQMLKDPKNAYSTGKGGKAPSSAVGAYQYTRSTLFGKNGTPEKPEPGSMVAQLGLSPNTRFTKELQDALAAATVQGHAQSSGGDIETFRTKLAGTWASVKGSSGHGAYAGQTARTALDTPTLMSVMTQTRAAAPVSTSTADLASAQSQATLMVLAQTQAPAMPTSSPAPAFIPYGIRPRDDSRDAFNQANAF